MEPLGFDSVRLLLWCPNCFEQHIDEDGDPPHPVHHCEFCGLQWKIMERNSFGVSSLPMRNTWTSNAKPKAFASLKDFNEAVEYATKHLQQTEADQEMMITRVIAAAKAKDNNHWYNSDLGCLFVLLGIAAIIVASGLYHYLVK